jgi:hypothetical protein
MKKNVSVQSKRLPFTKDDLRRLPTHDIVKVKLSDEEMRLLREVNEERKLERDLMKSMFAKDEISLLADLKKGGCEVNSVWDLVNTNAKYPNAIPVLAAHLEIPHLDRVIAGIARALAVKEAQHLWPLLASKYKSASEGVGDDGYPLWAKDGFAVALAEICTADTLPEMIELVSDKANGESRVLLLNALRKSKDLRAKKTIEELSFDSQLAKEISSWSERKRDFSLKAKH